MAEHPTRMERAAQSTLALAVARFGVPLLLAVIGFFLVQVLATIENTRKQVETTREDVATVKSDVRDLTTRLDAQVLRQVEANTKRLDETDARLRAVEQAVRP